MENYLPSRNNHSGCLELVTEFGQRAALESQRLPPHASFRINCISRQLYLAQRATASAQTARFGTNTMGSQDGRVYEWDFSSMQMVAKSPAQAGYVDGIAITEPGEVAY